MFGQGSGVKGSVASGQSSPANGNMLLVQSPNGLVERPGDECLRQGTDFGRPCIKDQLTTDHSQLTTDNCYGNRGSGNRYRRVRADPKDDRGPRRAVFAAGLHREG